jgi:flagellar basal-body rod modification protein FlgD
MNTASATITPTATSATLNGAPQAGQTDRASLADNFDQFLQLLTTQLKNQSPLDPLDTNQFTQQLVQFSQVEQQLKTNDQLGGLLASIKSSATTSALNYVGASITADGATSKLQAGNASWVLKSPRAVSSADITIKASNGETVYTGTRALVAGDNTFAWNGKGNGGQSYKDGEYTITVAAKDAGGALVSVKTEIAGTVDSVDVTGTTPILRLGSVTVAADKVKTISRQP